MFYVMSRFSFGVHVFVSGISELSIFKLLAGSGLGALSILMHVCGIFNFKVYFFSSTARAFRNVKPDVSRREEMFHNDVGVAIYCRNFLTLSN